MLRNLVLSASIAVASAAHLRAHANAIAVHRPHSHSATTVADTTSLEGVWVGQFQADHGDPGNLTLTITHDGEWKASVEMTYQNQPMPTRVHDFKVNGNTITWTQELMGGSCTASATLAAGTLRGETACGHGTVGYLLRKK
jgi:hypothetical protein